jgi:hypothetical protein
MTPIGPPGSGLQSATERVCHQHLVARWLRTHQALPGPLVGITRSIGALLSGCHTEHSDGLT